MPTITLASITRDVLAPAYAPVQGSVILVLG